mgnify:CR=1 FL=1
MSYAALLTSLRNLKLSGMAQSLEIRLQEAQSHQLSHAEFLELAVQDEVLLRSDRQIARRIKSAQFRDHKTLDDFDWSFNTSLPRKQVFDLATCRFIREAKDVLWACRRSSRGTPCSTGRSLIWYVTSCMKKCS